MTVDHKIALAEISAVLEGIETDALETTCKVIAQARHILLYGCGREGLQMRGLAMRLYHLGCSAGMVADMNAPPLKSGDLFIVSAGPGELSTVTALMHVARRDGACILFLTAVPDAAAAALADYVLLIPAQTMANDQSNVVRSVLPMGSLFEGALFILFEMIVLRLQDRLDLDLDQMRARHTNME
jgi:6-phospho-3-hexuloisomerase